MWAYDGFVAARNEEHSHPEKMQTMCKILPNAGQLEVYSHNPIIMDGMRQLKRVREVSLGFEDKRRPVGDMMELPVDLSVLPPTVTKLDLNNIGLDMRIIEDVQFDLRYLQVTPLKRGLLQTLTLISHQLKLEVVSPAPNQ